MKSHTSIRLLSAIALPIIVLLGLMLYKQSIINTGQSVTVDIVGFDPRDLLSGHYLRYNIDYNSRNQCTPPPPSSQQTVRLCLEPERYFFNHPAAQCHLYVEGVCSKTGFKAGIERFYIPEHAASQLDRLVRDARGTLQLRVNAQGKAVIETLFIDGEPWQDKVQ